MTYSDWIAFSALFLALIALAISIYELLSNKPKLRVTCSHGLMGKDRTVCVNVFNFGKQPTTINSVMFSHKHLVTSKGKAAQFIPSIFDEKPIKIRGQEHAQNKLIAPGEMREFIFLAEKEVNLNGRAYPLHEALEKHEWYVVVWDNWHQQQKTAYIKK